MMLPALTEEEKRELFNLVITCGTTTANTPRLVKLGLAITGTGRWGDWARVTKKGQDLVKSWPLKKRIEREADWIDDQCPQSSLPGNTSSKPSASSKSARTPTTSPTQAPAKPAPI